jgi:hypothetical protein
MRRIKKAPPEKAIRLIFKRLRKIYELGNELTAFEVTRAIHQLDKNCNSELSHIFNKSVHGELAISDSEQELAIAIYQDIYLLFKESRKTKRHNHKNAVKNSK